MALSNALFAGLSGLNVNQVKLNVVGNNIANVNTVAFKSTRTLFKPQFYVTDSGGSQPTGTSGGTNPSQRGLGAVVAALDRNFTGGSIETTGRPTDMAIDGEGFFIVKSDVVKYTRDGTFGLNQADQLITTSGDFVQGYGVDRDFNIIPGQLTNITIPLGSLTIAEATRKVTLSGTLNVDGPVASGASILTTQALSRISDNTVAPAAGTALTDIASASAPAVQLFSEGQVLTLAAKKGQSGSSLETASFTVGAGSTLGDLMNFFRNNLGINTTVPDDGNAATPTAGVACEASGATARIVITGNLGAENTLSLPVGSFTTAAGISPLAFGEGSNAAGIANNPVGESSMRTPVTVYDSLGTPIELTVTTVLESQATAGNTWRFYVETTGASTGQRAIGTGTLLFDNQGRLLESTGTTISIPREGTGAVTPLVFDLDVDQLKSVTNTSTGGVRTVLNASAPNGTVGTLDSFDISEDGTIVGTFSNGVTRTLGQVAVATFTNPQGLVDQGGGMFVEGASSGAATVGTPNTLGAGKVVAGALELSNVDLSEEFINLIIASTGFSAASRVITTSDQLISELLNTSR